MRTTIRVLSALAILVSGAGWVLVPSPRASAEDDLERVRLLSDDYDHLDSEAVALLRARRVEERSMPRAGSAAGTAPEAAGTDPLAPLEARADELWHLWRAKPRLLLAYAKNDRPSLLELVYSAAYFRQVIGSPQSSLEERAVAFCSLAFLPNANAYFSEDLRRAWREDVALAGDGPELDYLAQVFAWVDATPDELAFYERILSRSGVDGARAAAVNVLEDRMDTDPALHELFLWLRDNDPSFLVRRRIGDALRQRS